MEVDATDSHYRRKHTHYCQRQQVRKHSQDEEQLGFKEQLLVEMEDEKICPVHRQGVQSFHKRALETESILQMLFAIRPRKTAEV